MLRSFRRRRAVGARKVLLTLLMMLTILLLLETVLQVRSQFRFGQSVFNVLFADTTYHFDADTGLLLLRPNRIFAGSQVTLRSNSLGLRSPEISLTRSSDSWRLAVIGASTVMGAYAVDNDKTFPAQLERRLRQEFPRRKIEVVNAGIVGYGLDDQRRMLETLVAQLHPDLTIVYPGFNDFATYCRQQEATTPPLRRHGLPMLSMPSWLLSVDLIAKNTVFLRTTRIRQTTMLDPARLDLRPYRAKLEALTARAAELHLPLLLATNARAYRPEQSLAEQMRLSENARYYNHCLDLEGLHKLYDLHNRVIRSVAEGHHIPLIPLDQLVPGGSRYFTDSNHFSAAGEELVAQALAAFIVDKTLLRD